MSCQSRAPEGHCRDRGFSSQFQLLLLCYLLTPVTWPLVVGGKLQCCSSRPHSPRELIALALAQWPPHCSPSSMDITPGSCCSAGEKASDDPTPVCLSASLGHLDSRRQLLVCWPWLHLPPASLLACTPEGYFLFVCWLWSSSGPSNSLIFSIHWLSPSITPALIGSESHLWGGAPSNCVHSLYSLSEFFFFFFFRVWFTLLWATLWLRQ